MSMYLFDEQPIVANKTLAREIGLNEALILQQINYWIEINKNQERIIMMVNTGHIIQFEHGKKMILTI